MWARLMAYAGVAFGAACLWLLLGGSPAAADEGPSDLVGSLPSTAATPVAPLATEPATALAGRALRQVADVERGATDTVREVAAAVEPVAPLVDRATETVDTVATQVVGTGDRALDQLDQLDQLGPPTGAPPTAADPEVTQGAGVGSPAAVLRADRAPRPDATATPTLRTDDVRGPAAGAADQPSPGFRPTGPDPAPEEVPDTTPAPVDEAPDGTTAGGGAPVVTTAIPTTTVCLPETSGARVVRAGAVAPQPPASSPGFAPD